MYKEYGGKTVSHFKIKLKVSRTATARHGMSVAATKIATKPVPVCQKLIVSPMRDVLRIRLVKPTRKTKINALSPLCGSVTS